MTADRGLYTAAHAADYLDVSTDTIRRLAAQGDLLAVKLGANVRYAKKDLDALIERLRRSA
jgi:excisionase family DNA binding protein